MPYFKSHVIESRSSYYLVYEIYFVLHRVICIVMFHYGIAKGDY